MPLPISLTKKLTNAELLITDNGKGINIEAWQTNDGYGKELVQTFTEQLEGTLTLSVNNGTTFKMVVISCSLPLVTTPKVLI